MKKRTFYVEKELTNNSQDRTFVQLRKDGNQYCYIGDFEELQMLAFMQIILILFVIWIYILLYTKK